MTNEPAPAADDPGESRPPRRTGALRFVLLLALVGGVFGLLAATGGREYFTEAGMAKLRDSPWAVPVFILLYSLASFAFVPRGFLALAAGALFGWYSAAWTWIGAVIGETLAFGAARLLGREFVQNLMGEKLRALDTRFAGAGFQAIFVLRLIPLVPCDVINYGAGLASVRYRDFILATAVGIIPGCLLYAAAGHSLSRGELSTAVFGFGGLVLLAAIPWWWKRRKAARAAAEAGEAETNLDPAT